MEAGGNKVENFDQLALNWDQESRRIQRAQAVAGEILREIPGISGMQGFEYGCGTGLLSFQLQPCLKKIWLADSSDGMLQILKQKIAAQGISNMEPLLLDLTVDELPEPAMQIDLIYTLMTLHHVIDVDKVLSRFYELLAPEGILCIADLEKEDGSFHGKDFNGHNGFDTAELAETLHNIGFDNIKSSICYQTLNKGRQYPVFALFATK